MKYPKVFLFDFDGVFTDGKFYFDSKSIFTQKCYNAKDSLALKILNNKNIFTGIITNDKIVSLKNAEHVFNRLDFSSIGNSEKSKVEIVKDLLMEKNLNFNEIAYMGDDLADIELLRLSKYSGCPKDAIPEVKKVCKFISSKNGGEGAVREFVDHLLKDNDNDEVKLLDCTIRDGGYLNEWKFSDQEVIDAYQSASDAKYEYFEIGFKCDEKFFKNKWYGCKEEDIKNIKDKINNPCKLAVMIRPEQNNINNFLLKENSCIDMIRVLLPRSTKTEKGTICYFNEKDIKLTANLCRELVKKNYKITLNLPCCDLLELEEIEMVLKEINDIKIEYLYLADTYGGTDETNIEDIINKITILSKFKLNSKLGFHAHNNNENSLSKSLSAIKNGCKIIDTCIGGYGRGCGNLKSEVLLCEFLKSKKVTLNQIKNIFKFYDNHIMSKEYYNESKSLYHPYFCLAGALSIHPNYISQLLSEKFSVDEDIELIKILNDYLNDTNYKNYDKTLLGKLRG